MNNEIKAELVRAGIKQNELARKLRVSDTMISLVVAGKKQSARIQNEIARRLGVPANELWHKKAA